MTDLMLRLAELENDLFAIGAYEDGKTITDAEARIREQRELLEECERVIGRATEEYLNVFPMRTADFHNADCDCFRCCFDALTATLANLRAAQEKADE